VSRGCFGSAFERSGWSRPVGGLWRCGEGSGSDRSEESAVQDSGWPRGTHEAYLVALPGPLICWWQRRVGAFDTRRLRYVVSTHGSLLWRSCLRRCCGRSRPAVGVVSELGDSSDVDGMVQDPVPARVQTMPGPAASTAHSRLVNPSAPRVRCLT